MTNNINDAIVSDSNADLPLSLEASISCHSCAKELCVREKVINMAMGRVEVMYCLACLGKREDVQPEQLLAKIKNYILSRQCFQKEWVKYKDLSFCPDPKHCLPHNHDS